MIIIRRGDLFDAPEAIRALGKIGSDAAAAVDLLIGEVEKDGDSHTAMYAAEALGRIGRPAMRALAVLHAAATSEADGLALREKGLATTRGREKNGR